MLLLELLGELFQFADRDPEFTPLSQLAPSSAALFRMPPCLAPEPCGPSANHFAHFSEVYGGNLLLMRCN